MQHFHKIFWHLRTASFPNQQKRLHPVHPVINSSLVLWCRIDHNRTRKNSLNAVWMLLKRTSFASRSIVRERRLHKFRARIAKCDLGKELGFETVCFNSQLDLERFRPRFKQRFFIRTLLLLLLLLRSELLGLLDHLLVLQKLSRLGH